MLLNLGGLLVAQAAGGGSESTHWALGNSSTVNSTTTGGGTIDWQHDAQDATNGNPATHCGGDGGNTQGVGGWGNTSSIGIIGSTLSSSAITKDATYKDFSFSLPSSSTIAGIEVAVVAASTGSGTLQFNAQLEQGGSVIGTAKTGQVLNVRAQGEWTAIGGATDMWGTSLTQAQVESSTFGVRFWCDGADATTVSGWIYGVFIKVHYTHGGSTWNYYTSSWQEFASASGTGWTSPTNALADDASVATSPTLTGSDCASLFVTDLSGLSLPADAVVHGVQVNVQFSGTGSATAGTYVNMGLNCWMRNAGANLGTRLHYTKNTIGQYHFGYNTRSYVEYPLVCGEYTNGGVYTKAIVESSTFGVAISARQTPDNKKKTITATIDYVRARVLYRSQS